LNNEKVNEQLHVSKLSKSVHNDKESKNSSDELSEEEKQNLEEEKYNAT